MGKGMGKDQSDANIISHPSLHSCPSLREMVISYSSVRLHSVSDKRRKGKACGLAWTIASLQISLLTIEY